MKRNGGREFFEVFRRLPEAEKSRAWWSKKQPPSTDSAAPASSAAASEPSTTTTTGAVKPRLGKLTPDTTTPPGRVTLTFSREALLVGGIAIVGVLVLAFVWGYTTGQNSRAPREESVAARTPAEAPAAVARAAGPALPAGAGRTATLSVGVAPKPAPFWALRIISGVPGQRAKEMAGDLRAMGYDAFTLKVGGWYTVNVGRFQDRRAAEATDLKARFDAMVYKGNRWFKSCVWLKITETGSIEL